MKLNAILEYAFEQAGLKDLIPDEKLKPIFMLENDVEDEVANKLVSGLFGMSSALQNGKIRAHHVGHFLKGSEERLKKQIENSGLDETTILEIEGEQRFNERVEKFVSAMAKKAAEPAKGSEGVNKKFAEAMAELEELKKTHVPKTELEQIQATWNAEKQDLALMRQISGLSWSENYAEDMRLPLFKMGMEKKLNTIGAKLVYDNGEFKLVQKDSPDLEYFDSKNKKVTFADISKDIAFENKFIAVTPAPTTNTNPSTTDTLKTPVTTGKQNKALDAFDDALAKFNVQ